MKFNTAFALLVTMLTIESRFDVVASSSSSSSNLDGSDPQATRKTRVLKPKNANSCQQQETTIAGLEREVVGLEREVETCKSSLNDDDGFGGGECTAPGKDAFNNESGGELPCCDSQIAMYQTCPDPDRPDKCLLCPPSLGPPGPDLLCEHEAVDNESWWTHGTNYNSCANNDGIGTYKNVGFSKCVGDETSISLNMADLKKEDKDNNCFVHDTKQKISFKIQDINGISFDAEWDKCGDVWTAPIWLAPSQWIPPQGLSGEIDLIETCKSAKYGIRTAIICDEPAKKDMREWCIDDIWGRGRSSNGAQHFIGKIHDETGDWTMHKCNYGETNVDNCQLISKFPRYLYTTHGTTQQQEFHFVSDVWGHRGKCHLPGSNQDCDPGSPGCNCDPGFPSCGNYDKPDTKCSYTVANIKIDYKNK